MVRHVLFRDPMTFSRRGGGQPAALPAERRLVGASAACARSWGVFIMCDCHSAIGFLLRGPSLSAGWRALELSWLGSGTRVRYGFPQRRLTSVLTHQLFIGSLRWLPIRLISGTPCSSSRWSVAPGCSSGLQPIRLSSRWPSAPLDSHSGILSVDAGESSRVRSSPLVSSSRQDRHP